MKKSHSALLILSTALLGLVSVSNSCEPYRPTSTPKTSTLGNPVRGDTEFAVGKYAQISSFSICLKEMILTGISGDTATVPYSAQSEIEIPVTGMDLDSLSVPPGQYTKISLELADQCGRGRSLSVTNGKGVFSSRANVSIRFSGNEFVGSGRRKIVFDVQSLAAKLSQADSESGLVIIAAGTLGDYHSVGCGMRTNSSDVAFCETFDQPSSAVGRGGQLDSAVWTVSRTGMSNQGQGQLNLWDKSSIDACGVAQPAEPDGSDFVVCNGQLRESTFDNGAMTILTLSPNQIFDFTGRTGSLSFDVTNDTKAGVWPELWISDQYIPGQHSMWTPEARAKNAVGLRFAGAFEPNSGAQAPGCVNDGHSRWIIDSIHLIRNYAAEEVTWMDQNLKLTTLGCVIASDGPNGKMNHIEVRVSQDLMEVWASDAGSPDLKKIAVMQNLNLPFSRGYLTFGDYHNNPGTYGRPELANHTFAWDNIAFDGPSWPMDVVAGVLDNVVDMGSGQLSLGWLSESASPTVVTTQPLTASQVSAAQSGGSVVLSTGLFVPFGFSSQTIRYSVNGVQLSAAYPFAIEENARQAISLPVPASALKVGPQTISIWGGGMLIIYNIDLRLVGIAP
ncbi:MAG: hypothetical protein AB7F86_17115 [Bdellovibrionales bacterium]